MKNLMFGTMIGYVYGADGTRVSTGTIQNMNTCDPSPVSQGGNGFQATKDSILGPTGGQLTEMSVSSGNVTWAHTNVWANGQLIATYDPNGLHFFLSDWTGSRRVQTDYQGVVEQTCTNLPYGDGPTCGATPTENLYAGLEWDNNANVYNAMYRQYAPAFGRWSTPDPYGGSYDVFNPQSMNRYAYVGGSPFGAVDPSGLDGSSWFYAGVVSNSDLYGSTVGSWLNSLAPFVPFLDAADLAYNVFGVFDDFGEAFGWWGGGSPFHGNVQASQSGKNVPGASSGLGLTLRNSPSQYDQFYNQLPDWAQSTLNFGQSIVDFGTGSYNYSDWWQSVKSCVGGVGIPAILDDANPFGTGGQDAAAALAPGAADAASRYFYNQALTHALNRGLTTPLRSSIYRGLMGKSATASAVGDAVPLAIVDKALFAGVRAEAAGCQ